MAHNNNSDVALSEEAASIIHSAKDAMGLLDTSPLTVPQKLLEIPTSLIDRILIGEELVNDDDSNITRRHDVDDVDVACDLLMESCGQRLNTACEASISLNLQLGTAQALERDTAAEVKALHQAYHTKLKECQDARRKVGTLVATLHHLESED